MIEQLKKSLEEFDDEFAIRVDEKIGDKIYKNQDYGDFYGERKDVKHFLITHTISILEAEKERYQNKIDDMVGLEEFENEIGFCHDQISYLDQQIKEIKEL